jgi:hypothetical protein
MSSSRSCSSFYSASIFFRAAAQWVCHLTNSPILTRATKPFRAPTTVATMGTTGDPTSAPIFIDTRFGVPAREVEQPPRRLLRIDDFWSNLRSRSIIFIDQELDASEFEPLLRGFLIPLGIIQAAIRSPRAQCPYVGALAHQSPPCASPTAPGCRQRSSTAPAPSPSQTRWSASCANHQWS